MSAIPITKVTFNLPSRELDALKQLARRRSISVTQALRQAITTEHFIQQLADEHKKLLVQDQDGSIQQLVFNQTRAQGGAMASLAERSQSPVPSDAFERFPGRWIAVRDGMVTADAATLDELDANPQVEATDVRFRVPEPDSQFF